MKLSRDVIIVLLVVLLAFGGLVVRYFPFSQGDFDKEMPPIVTSFDLFADTSYTKYIYDTEDARYNPPYRVMGVTSLTIQPVHFFLFVATFTKLTTLSPYQTLIILTFIISILLALVAFFLFKRAFGWKIGLLAFTLAMFPQAKWMFQLYIGFLYDQFAFLFIPAIAFFLMSFFEKEYDTRQVVLAGILIGFFAVTQWLSHFVELLLAVPLFGLLWLFFAWKQKWNKNFFIIAIACLITFTPYFLYFYPITKQGHLAGGFGEKFAELVNIGEPSPYPGYWPNPRFSTWLNIFGIVGLVYLVGKAGKRQWNAYQLMVLALLFYLLAIGFSNYIGLDANRAGRQLFNAFSLFVIFPAVGIYLLYALVTSHKLLKPFSTALFLILIGGMVFVAAPKTFAELEAIDRGAFVDDEKWASIEWIRDQTPPESRVYYLNGFYHEFAMLGERPFSEGIVLPNPESMQYNFERLCSGNWTPTYAGHWGNGEFAYATEDSVYVKERTGWDSFTYVRPFDDPESRAAFKYNMAISYVPLTFFDYAVIEYQGTQFDPCVVFFLNQSLERGHTLAWNNNKMAILKINKTARP